MQRPIFFLSLSMTLLLSACGDDKNATDTDANTSTGTTAGATDTDPTSTGTTPGTATGTATDTKGSATATGDDATAGSATDPGDSSTTIVSTTDIDPTTGGMTTGGSEFMELCQDFCQILFDCTEQPVASCLKECVSNFENADALCKEASEGFFACLATMTCDQLIAFMETDDAGACVKQNADYEASCPDDEDCSASVGSNQEGTECAYQVSCPNIPDQAMTCDAKSCVCSTGGMDVGSCPAEAVCMDLGTIEAKAFDCCGF